MLLERHESGLHHGNVHRRWGDCQCALDPGKEAEPVNRSEEISRSESEQRQTVQRTSLNCDGRVRRASIRSFKEARIRFSKATT